MLVITEGFKKNSNYINVSNVGVIQLYPLKKGIQLFAFSKDLQRGDSKEFYFEGNCQIIDGSIYMENVKVIPKESYQYAPDNPEYVDVYQLP